MKKLIAIVFAISLIAPSSAQADDFSDKTKLQQNAENLYRTSIEQINQQYSKNVLDIKNNYDLNLQKIKNTAGVKETQSISDYNNAFLKWKEVDQVKVLNDTVRHGAACKMIGPNNCAYEVVWFNSRFTYDGANGLAKITLSTQDQSRSPSIAGYVLGPIISGETRCCAAGGINGGRDTIYNLVAGWKEWEQPNWIDFNWDFEWEHAKAGMKWHVPAQTILSFEQGWIWPVKLDGTAIPYSEFSTIRNNVKTSYSNMLSAQSQHRNLISSANTEYANQMANAEKSKNSLIAKAESDRTGALSSISWVDDANNTLISHFPDKIKSELMKDGYFKPLKPFYYTSKTGRYIVSARMIDNYTVVATAGPEYKRYKYVYTKKEQADHIRSSNDLLKQQTKPYYDTIDTAKSMGWKVECKDKTPCKIKYIKN